MSSLAAQSDWIADAELRRDIGIEHAAAGANMAVEGWTDKAYQLLQDFLRVQQGVPFLAEFFVGWAKSRIEAPHDPRAWGKPVQRAARAGLIERVGYAKANSSNRSPKALWRART